MYKYFIENRYSDSGGMMNEDTVKDKILAIVDAGGGRVPFEAVKDGLDYQEQSVMINVLRRLKADGIAQKQVRLVNGKPVFEVFRIGAPVPTQTS